MTTKRPRQTPGAFCFGQRTEIDAEAGAQLRPNPNANLNAEVLATHTRV
jgi:hypothetical protein